MDEILNQHGEVTDVTAPEDFGKELSFVNPDDMPDLETAEVGFNIQPESIEFKNPGETLRAVFNGFTTFKVKDKVNKGQYLPRKTVVLQARDGLKINMGANLIKQLELIPVGTAVQITYEGEQRTTSGNDVKTYKIQVLKVPRVNIPAKPEPPKIQAPPPPAFLHMERKDEFWKLAYQMRLTNDEGLELLTENGNDFARAIEALTPGFIEQ